jgi:hypothetical protein
MLLARIFGLTILVLTIAPYPIIGIQAQSSKTGEQTRTPQPKQPAQKGSAASLPRTGKSQGPFDSLTQFSATMVGGLSGNTDEIKIYRSGNLMWVEAYNKVNHLVTDLSTRETYFMLMEAKERCIHNGALAVQSFPFAFFRPDHKIERTPAGEAVVDGHHCHIESVVRTAPSGGAMHVKFWEADDLNGFPVKIEVDRPGGKVVTIRYKDVKLGPPDPALFARPKNCEPGPERSEQDSQ